MLYLQARIKSVLSKTLANFISYSFHPGLMPTYLLAVLYFISPYILAVDGYTAQAKLLLLLFIFIYSFLFPTLIIFWLYKRRKITDMKLGSLKERRLPYLITITSLGFLSYFFYTKSVFLKPTSIILGIVLFTLISVAVISLKWQISAHSAAAGGVLGILFTLRVRFDEISLQWPFFAVLVLAGVIASSRLRLNAHTFGQITAGLLLGLIGGLIGALYI
jgi:membrane-associated phospholipid phosphatase